VEARMLLGPLGLAAAIIIVIIIIASWGPL
jgi:hypothetical protein